MKKNASKIDKKGKIKIIKINPKDKVKGFYTLLTNGSVKCYKNNKYMVPNYCLGILKKERVSFEVIK